MPAAKLKELLDSEHVRYSTIRHSAAYTSQEIASLAHIPGKELAKTVMVRVDGERMVMAILPASFRVDLDELGKAVRAGSVSLATEAEFRGRFPDCEMGAMPPFGNLYGMPVVVDAALTEDAEIAFNAGSHSELIRMSYSDFERLVHPSLACFSRQP